MKLWHLAVTACALLVSSGTTLAGVIVVDAAGGGSFTQVQPAVNAAVDGDTILVKPGNYSGFILLRGKSLTVVGDVGMPPNFLSSIQLTDLAPDQVVTLARLKVSGRLSVDDSLGPCLGAVRVNACEFTGVSGTQSISSPKNGVYVKEAPNVAFTGCAIRGGNGLDNTSCAVPHWGEARGADGLQVFESSVASYECAIDGGDGANGGDLTGSGGEGVYAWGASPPAFFFASRSNIHGGTGGSTDCAAYGCARRGGDGIYLRNNAPEEFADPTGWFLDLMIGGGMPGTWTNGNDYKFCGFDGAGPGQAFTGVPGFTFSAASLGFSIPAIAREGDFVTVTFTGPPGAHVYLNDRLTTTFEAVASWRGVLLAPFAPVGAPMREIKWGVIPASGVLTRTYAVPQLPPGVEAQTRFLQAYRVGANGITLGSFRTLTILDSAF